MEYTKTNWKNNGGPAINATNLNKMEDGILAAKEDIDNINKQIEEILENGGGGVDFDSSILSVGPGNDLVIKGYKIARLADTINGSSCYITTTAQNLDIAGYWISCYHTEKNGEINSKGNRNRR